MHLRIVKSVYGSQAMTATWINLVGLDSVDEQPIKA